jgi:hypothetical protein
MAQYLRCVYTPVKYLHRSEAEQILEVAVYMCDWSTASMCIKWLLSGTEQCSVLCRYVQWSKQLQYEPLRQRTMRELARGIREYASDELARNIKKLEQADLVQLIRAVPA